MFKRKKEKKAAGNCGLYFWQSLFCAVVAVVRCRLYLTVWVMTVAAASQAPPAAFSDGKSFDFRRPQWRPSSYLLSHSLDSHDSPTWLAAAGCCLIHIFQSSDCHLQTYTHWWDYFIAFLIFTNVRRSALLVLRSPKDFVAQFPCKWNERAPESGWSTTALIGCNLQILAIFLFFLLLLLQFFEALFSLSLALHKPNPPPCFLLHTWHADKDIMADDWNCSTCIIIGCARNLHQQMEKTCSFLVLCVDHFSSSYSSSSSSFTINIGE